MNSPVINGDCPQQGSPQAKTSVTRIHPIHCNNANMMPVDRSYKLTG